VTVGSLFSGIGGIDLALERAGMSVAWQVENDPYCQRVLAKHWPAVRRYRDVRELTGYELESVDLIAGGFPCQPVSVAGKRLAQADTRWLWPEFIRLIRVVRPRYVFVENVPGLLVRGMGDVLGDLAASGYDAEWDCIPAAAVGAHHRRNRVWIVAYTATKRLEGRLFSEASRNSLAQFASESGRWPVEPDVGRVAHGVSARVDRLKGLGNACVPQVVEWIGRMILAFDKASG